MNTFVCMRVLWRAIADTRRNVRAEKNRQIFKLKMYKPTDHKSRGQGHWS